MTEPTATGFDPADVHIVHIGIQVDEAAIIETGRYCPAPVPCLGRPAVGVAVPVRIIPPSKEAGRQVSEARGVYCPRCATFTTEPTRDDG